MVILQSFMGKKLQVAQAESNTHHHSIHHILERNKYFKLSERDRIDLRRSLENSNVQNFLREHSSTRSL
jgi:hypothetical protein